jgi:tetratricopeptide (TPR) repeat protein
MGQEDAAAAELEQAMLLDPTDALLKVQRGWIAYYKDELGRTTALAEQAAALAPASGAAYDLLGAVFTRFGRTEATKAAFEKAVALEPNEPLYRYHLFDYFDRWKLQREALEQADALLKLPDARILLPYSIAYEGVRTSFKTATRLGRARLLTKMGRFEDAQVAFDQVVRDNPSALAHTLRAQFRAKREAPAEEIMADLDRARALDPDFWLAFDVLGRVQFYAKHYEAAAETFAREAKLKPNDGETRWWRAISLRAAGRSEEAKSEALATLDIDPGYILRAKFSKLQKVGYLPPGRPDAITREGMRDAVVACMIDARCW